MNFTIILHLPDFTEIPKREGSLDLEFQGGISMIINGVNITKLKNNGNPCVFEDYILIIIEDWLKRIPLIIKDVECRCDLFDNPWTFNFKPSGENVQIAFFYYGEPGNISPDIINSTLEGEGKPFSVPKELFIKQVIKVSEELIDLLQRYDQSLKKKKTFNDLISTLRDAKNTYKTYYQLDGI